MTSHDDNYVRRYGGTFFRGIGYFIITVYIYDIVAMLFSEEMSSSMHYLMITSMTHFLEETST